MTSPTGLKALVPELSFHRGSGLTCVCTTASGTWSVTPLSSSGLHRKWYDTQVTQKTLRVRRSAENTKQTDLLVMSAVKSVKKIYI